MTDGFQLALFSTDAAFIREAVSGGVSAVIVDWERQGKKDRQANVDTQIGTDTLADLERVRNATQVQVICRVNSFNATTADEIEQAIGAGADEILLPMVRTATEVERTLKLAAGRCGVGVLLETVEAVHAAAEIGQLPICRAYVGLNDLRIARATPSIFTALVDGTVDAARSHFSAPFGFGGLTLPDRGSPIPCSLLIGEMMRLRSNFSFLRRAFHRDVRGRNIGAAVETILRALSEAAVRDSQSVSRERAQLLTLIAA